MKHSQLSGLYGITDTKLIPNEILLKSVESALKGGMRILQYRNKTDEENVKREQGKRLAELCKKYNAIFLINDDVSLCLDTAADGVHLGQGDGDIAKARDQLGENKIIGVTCHDQIPFAQKAINKGADYVAFGRLFASNTKPTAPPCSLETIREAAELSVPVVAIGGINIGNAQSAISAGSDMIAVIEGLFGQKDIFASAQALSHLFNKV